MASWTGIMTNTHMFSCFFMLKGVKTDTSRNPGIEREEQVDWRMKCSCSERDTKAIGIIYG